MESPRLNNPKDPKERNLVKGAIRRVFSRSMLRREALQKSLIDHYDPDRKRVTKWSLCPICQKPKPTYTMEVDHVVPIIALDESLETISWDTLIDRVWCDVSNLKAVCKECHKAKTKIENAERRRRKKERKNEEA